MTIHWKEIPAHAHTTKTSFARDPWFWVMIGIFAAMASYVLRSVLH